MTSTICFDLHNLKVTHFTAPNNAWLLVDQKGSLPESAPFLLSLSDQHPHFKSMQAQGTASSLKQAYNFFQTAIEGKCALQILPMVLQHFNQIGNMQAEAALATERINFAKQFETNISQQGLRGFLEKRSKRFDVGPKHYRELQQVLQWLEARL